MGCQSCRTGTVQAEVTLEAKKGTVDMEYQSCRTGTVQADHEVTWRPGKIQ